MSKVQMLRALVKQRLTAAAEEIFGLFERTIAEYEEELCRSKEENHRQRHLLDAVFNPDVHLQAADVQQVLKVKAEVPPDQQGWSSSLDQEDPDPTYVKEEQEETDVIKFTLTHVQVKSEHEEKPQSSQLHRTQTEESRNVELKTESEGEDCRGSEPETSSEPDVKRVLADEEEIHLKQQDGSSRLDQDDPDLPYIKEEQEQADIIKFTLNHILVKSEDDEENPQSSQLHQRQTGRNKETEPRGSTSNEHMKRDADGEDSGGSEPDTNSQPADCLLNEPQDATGFSSSNAWITSSSNFCSADVQQPAVNPPGQQEWSSSMDPADPVLPHMKEEQEQTSLTFTLTQNNPRSSQLRPRQIEKSREAEPQTSSSTKHMKMGSDGEDYGGPDPATGSHQGRGFHLHTDCEISDSSTPQTDGDDDWKDKREPQSGFNLQNNCFLSNNGCHVEKLLGCSDCSARCSHKDNLKTQNSYERKSFQFHIL
ncbi:uncharacterized protein LOC117525397 isoform X2 [Thalassophryne amazonica]|uniref:uncharacterized protein LOC117525397 isoform X2 n=1 Tax=Thalassophryne amazonica TaxID=390379 RepID=UPI00147223E4|nr:uncharacterized protein LOC117525397 isoform X2 [Thalassophryne amazonica]